MAAKTLDMKGSKRIFQWEGINKCGEKMKGEISAISTALVKAQLRHQGIQPKKVYKKWNLFGQRKKTIHAKEISVFSRQLATMMKAGIPIVQSFDIVARGVTNASLRHLILEIKSDVGSGMTFANALKKHPKYFNDLYCNLVNAGEQSGCLDVIIEKVATYKEKTETLKGKIKKALYYPAAVIVVVIMVTGALLIFVVPQFQQLFAGFGGKLPTMTRFVIYLSQIFQHYGWMILGAMGVAIYGFIEAKKRSKKVAHAIDYFLLKMPVIGVIIEKATIARFSRTLAITFAAGLPLVDALKSVAGVTGNVIFTDATSRIREDVATGQQMQLAMRNTQLFPTMVIQMVAIGEGSGSLEQMLSKVADFYEEEVDNAVDGLSSLLEPFIMVILGVLVGGLVIAMYLPIFKLGSVI